MLFIGYVTLCVACLPPDPDVAGPARQHSSTSSPGENLPSPLDLAHLFPRHMGHFCGRTPHAGDSAATHTPAPWRRIPYSTPRSPPNPENFPSGSRVMRGVLPTQKPVDLTPGWPISAISGEFSPRAAAGTRRRRPRETLAARSASHAHS